MQADRILPIDRFTQAYYSVERIAGQDRYTQPLKDMREYKLFNLSIDFSDEDSARKLFPDAIKAHLGKLQDSSTGILRISNLDEEGGHSTFMQIDLNPKHRNFCVSDANIGFLDLHPPKDQTQESI